jgi:hypothetical protein
MYAKDNVPVDAGASDLQPDRISRSGELPEGRKQQLAGFPANCFFFFPAA